MNILKEMNVTRKIRWIISVLNFKLTQVADFWNVDGDYVDYLILVIKVNHILLERKGKECYKIKCIILKRPRTGR